MISFFDNLLLCQRWLFAQHSVSVRSVFKSAEESFNYVSVNDSITANRRRQTAVSLRRYWTTTNGLSSACAGWRLFAWMFSVMKDNMHHYRGKASWSVLQCSVMHWLHAYHHHISAAALWCYWKCSIHINARYFMYFFSCHFSLLPHTEVLFF